MVRLGGWSPSYVLRMIRSDSQTSIVPTLHLNSAVCCVHAAPTASSSFYPAFLMCHPPRTDLLLCSIDTVAAVEMSGSPVLLSVDLVSVWASFLPVSDLFRASSVCSTFSSLLSNDRVWSPLLSSALALSTLPGPPPPLSPARLLFVPVPPTALASRLCREALSDHIRAVAVANGRRVSSSTSVTVIAIRRLPSSLQYHMRAAVRAMKSAGRAMLSEGADQMDCRCYELEWLAEKREWRVVEVGEAGSGCSVINTVDEASDSTDGSWEAVSDSWDDDTWQSVAELAEQLGSSDVCKQQYIRTFACSCHPQYRCDVLLAPQPPLPAPSPAADASPGLFNENHSSLLSYPALSPVPVCRTCRSSVAYWMSSQMTAYQTLRPPVQMRCVVRVNADEWDVCYGLYQHAVFLYKRIQMRWRYDRFNSGGSWQAVRVYRAHSGGYCNQLPANVE